MNKIIFLEGVSSIQDFPKIRLTEISFKIKSKASCVNECASNLVIDIIGFDAVDKYKRSSSNLSKVISFKCYR